MRLIFLFIYTGLWVAQTRVGEIFSMEYIPICCFPLTGITKRARRWSAWFRAFLKNLLLEAGDPIASMPGTHLAKQWPLMAITLRSQWYPMIRRNGRISTPSALIQQLSGHC